MNIDSKKLVIFDLDGTLTQSKSNVDPDMAGLIVKLLVKKKVAVISGGGFPQFQTQFLAALPGSEDNYSNLYILPTSGTRMYAWRNGWVEQYAENLNHQEKEDILTALNMALRSVNYEKPEKIYGQIIEDRGSQITFSALGQSAPVELKMQWDPTRTKREAMALFLQKKIPNFESRIGGATSVDITRLGVNKGYGIRKLELYLKISSEDIVFVGDALFYGGNDYPAKAMGIDCVEVKGPEDTKTIVEGWVG